MVDPGAAMCRGTQSGGAGASASRRFTSLSECVVERDELAGSKELELARTRLRRAVHGRRGEVVSLAITLAKLLCSNGLARSDPRYLRVLPRSRTAAELQVLDSRTRGL